MDLVEARQKIEVDIVGLAAERRDVGDLAELRRLLGEMERLSAPGADPAGFVDADVAFHLRLAEAGRNSALRDVLSGVQALLRAWISRVIAAGETSGASYREHVPIFAAVEAGDVAAAERAMDDHMRGAAGRLARALAEAQGRGELDRASHGGHGRGVDGGGGMGLGGRVSVGGTR